MQRNFKEHKYKRLMEYTIGETLTVNTKEVIRLQYISLHILGILFRILAMSKKKNK